MLNKVPISLLLKGSLFLVYPVILLRG